MPSNDIFVMFLVCDRSHVQFKVFAILNKQPTVEAEQIITNLLNNKCTCLEMLKN